MQHAPPSATSILSRARCQLTLRQPNVAALLNNVYALPVFTLAAVFCEGLDLGVVEFASKVLPVLL